MAKAEEKLVAAKALPAPATAAEKAAELVAAYNKSSRAAAESLNKVVRTQEEVVEIMKEVFRQTGRYVPGVQTLPDGTKILLSARIGENQAIVAVAVNGKAVFGSATISLDATANLVATGIILPK